MSLTGPKRKKESNALREKRLRLEVLLAYGGRCICCGETRAQALCLDHVVPASTNPEVQARRRRLTTWPYRDAKARGFPDDYQVLCFNCNIIKGVGAACHCREAATVLEALALVPRRPRATGTAHYMATPEEKIQQVYALLATGGTYRAIEAQTGVSRSVVARISQGRHYSCR